MTTECAKLRPLCAFVRYVSRVLACLTCLTYLLAFVPLLLTCFPLSTSLTCLHFSYALRASHAFVFLHPLLTCLHFLFALPAFIFIVLYVLYVPSLFTCLTCALSLRVFICAVSYVDLFFTCLHFIYVYANKHHIN